MKTTFFTHYVSYLNPEAEGFSSKIDRIYGQLRFKFEMGVAGPNIELRPSNLVKMHNFHRCTIDVL